MTDALPLSASVPGDKKQGGMKSILEGYKNQFVEICEKEITRNGVQGILAWLEGSDFYEAPASTRFHGSYQGGLLAHSLNVYDALMLINASLNLQLPTESMAIVALFHDVCKANFYATELRNVKDEATGQWHKEPFYKVNEQFCYGGHGSKSVYIVNSFIRLLPDEAVAINCHMGSWDGNKDVGAAFEKTPLAWALHVADEYATFILEGKAQ